MTSTKSVQNTRISGKLRDLHVALLEILSVMNQPQRDDALMEEAGISLDRALFPLLVGIERFGPIGIVDLADRSGRDHTTVSRQVAKLEGLGLVSRQANATDGRVREAVATAQGKATTAKIDLARERIGKATLEDWPEQDIDDLVRLMVKFAGAIRTAPARQNEAPDR